MLRVECDVCPAEPAPATAVYIVPVHHKNHGLHWAKVCEQHAQGYPTKRRLLGAPPPREPDVPQQQS